MSCSFLSWNDLFLSCADLAKVEAAVLNNSLSLVEVEGVTLVAVATEVEGCGLAEVELICSGTKSTRPSKILVMVESTFLVLPAIKLLLTRTHNTPTYSNPYRSRLMARVAVLPSPELPFSAFQYLWWGEAAVAASGAPPSVASRTPKDQKPTTREFPPTVHNTK